MKFIEHSNSVYKSNSKYVSPKRRKVRKIILEVIIFVFCLSIFIGVLNESAQNSNALNSLRSSHRLGSYDDYILAYGISGNGSSVVLFESDIGKTLLQWNQVIINPISGTKMIYYDRLGYGGSDFWKGSVSVELQSEILNSLVTNSGYSGKRILVSEGYGTLIHLEHLKRYEDEVGGMILINPPIFGDNERNYLSDIFEDFKNAVLKLFSNLGIPRMLDKFSMLGNDYIDLYREKAVSRNKDSYLSRMVSRDYYSIVSKEKSSMKKYLSKFDFDSFGIYNIPIVIIESTQNKNEDRENILKNHFKNAEIIYIDDLNEFTYSNSSYLAELILNMSFKVN